MEHDKQYPKILIYSFLKKLFPYVFPYLYANKTLDKEKTIYNTESKAGISFDYLLSLIIAALIATIGLITNSVAVIIGSMLISPLLEPIIGLGLAITTENNQLIKKLIFKIIVSVILTIVFTTILTTISPLKEPTTEIISRTNPNLYDLLIALFSGIVGVYATIKNKNNLTIIPGVAIATAIIPPLSIIGFGIGTSSYLISMGAFLLFFTNFIAILFSSVITFIYFGFLTKIEIAAKDSVIRKRLTQIFITMIIISIPLIYSLYTTVSYINLNNQVSNIIKQDIKNSANLYYLKVEEKSDKIYVSAIILAKDYLNEQKIKEIKKNLEDKFKKPVDLKLSQIIGQMPKLSLQNPQQPITPIQTPEEKISNATKDINDVFKTITDSINKLISPDFIESYNFAVSNKGKDYLTLEIKGNHIFSLNETKFIQNYIENIINTKINLTINTKPFLTPIPILNENDFKISTNDINNLQIIKNVYSSNKNISININCNYNNNALKSAAEQKIASIINYIESSLKIPSKSINSKITFNPTAANSSIKIDFQ
ncbi:TIGR00341 family protein [Thermodesulfobium sp. 4217-1]|uniref:TIGR00341 family protein n=1 Tax=Thermodesulfobium sp. 4217-1 TaxID=3120013 RepID=UPI003221B02F